VAPGDLASRRHRDGIRTAGRRPRSGSEARAASALTVALPGEEGDYWCQPASADPFVHQEIVEILYHTLWETVHVFLERCGEGLDSGDASFLYPYLGGQAQDAGALIPEVVGSIRMKAADDSRLRALMAERAFEEIWNASVAISRCVARGGKLILFGNLEVIEHGAA
jgi:D-sedoheptulose 7-phosphate isomerase